MSLVVGTNGVLRAPTNFFYANSNLLNASISAVGGGVSQIDFDAATNNLQVNLETIGTNATNFALSLVGGGMTYYAWTNIDETATNNDSASFVYKFQSDIPSENTNRAYTGLTNGQYVGSVITTNTFSVLSGIIAVNSYLGISGGGSLQVKPEIYYSYDKTNWFGDWEASYQSIGTGSNLYQWIITPPITIATNAVGFYVERRFKVNSVVAAPTLRVFVGTNTPAHIHFETTSAGSGYATLNANQTFTGSNIFTGGLYSDEIYTNSAWGNANLAWLRDEASYANLDDWNDTGINQIPFLNLPNTFTETNTFSGIIITNTDAGGRQFSIWTNGQVVFCITNGRVGIGLLPSASLDVSGSISSSGNIFSGSTFGVIFGVRGSVTTPADGLFSLRNNAGSDFSGVIFGTNNTGLGSVAYPRLNRVGGGLSLTSQDGVARSSNHLAIGGIYYGDGSGLTNVTGASSTNVTVAAGTSITVTTNAGVGYVTYTIAGDTNSGLSEAAVNLLVTNNYLALVATNIVIPYAIPLTFSNAYFEASIAASNGQAGSVFATNIQTSLTAVSNLAVNGSVFATNLQTSLTTVSNLAVDGSVFATNLQTSLTTVSNMAVDGSVAVTNTQTSLLNVSNYFAPTNIYATTSWVGTTFAPTGVVNTLIANATNFLANTNVYATTNWVGTTFITWATTNTLAPTNTYFTNTALGNANLAWLRDEASYSNLDDWNDTQISQIPFLANNNSFTETNSFSKPIHVLAAIVTNNIQYIQNGYPTVDSDGTNYVFDATKAFSSITLTNGFAISRSTNLVAGLFSTFVILGTASGTNLTFPAGWHWQGITNNPPTAINAGKYGVLSILVNGIYETNIHAGFSREQ